MSVTIREGDCLDVLRTLDSQSVQCCVTSPPYFGLRDYGMPGQLGLEPTPDEYVAKMVEVFRAVRRGLADDGTLWLNLGDSYAHSLRQSANQSGDKQNTNKGSIRRGFAPITPGLKEKDLIGIPWLVAFALRADGWYLRSDIIWSKKNCMPESVTDRPTKAHEYLFLLSKSERYYYDAEAIKEPVSDATLADRPNDGRRIERSYPGQANRGNGRLGEGETRNKRSVWHVASSPYLGAHFATFPPALIEPCILAGSRVGDTILDPFGGAGTTGLVADRLSRNALLIELNPDYAKLARDRIRNDNPLFAEIA